MSISFDSLSLENLLTVDTHGDIIYIQDREAEEPHKLIPSREVFFRNDGLFANVEPNGLTRIFPQGHKKRIGLNDLLELTDNSQNSVVVFIEGFAGCGKSTLVQYILSKQLESYSYNYYFYNYNLEAQNDLLTHNDSGNKVEKSSIYEAIKKCFITQFISKMRNNRNNTQHISVLNDFIRLLESCQRYSPFSDLYYNFFNRQAFDDICCYIKNNITEKNRRIVERLLYIQTGMITSSTSLLALDYLFRLALYKNGLIRKLYICYDNLDAIEDADDLIDFDDRLAAFRKIIDTFIVYMSSQGFFRGQVKPHFVILATYRKITAVIAEISKTVNKEVVNDRLTNPSESERIIHIDATSAFSYSKIVLKRKEYFENYFNSGGVIDISNTTKQKLLHALRSWNKLNQNLVIMSDRYACLWNKNYRTCSLIANLLYSDSGYEFSECVDLIENSKFNDGYASTDVEDGTSILCAYYGSSSILLSYVCKVFNANRIWDRFLFLSPLSTLKPSYSLATQYKNVSLSRLVLTYIYNNEEPVSLEKLIEVFCSKNLFQHVELCKILSKMLARNPGGVWRRPIYYSNYPRGFIGESSEEIEKALLKECQYILANNRGNKCFGFQLCESGKSYVERLMQEFEFFSNRVSNSNKSLYLYNDANEISRTIGQVFNAVANCCQAMLSFRLRYLELFHITEDEYLLFKIHPTTNQKNPQLHSERTIFSHISYLNNVRLYYLDETVTPELENRKKYNELFVRYIEMYLLLYKEKIMPISSKRVHVAVGLNRIVNEIITAISHDNEDLDVLFQPISLKKQKRGS